MHIDHSFEDFCKIDTTRIEYINLKQSLLAVDWGSEAWVTSDILSYTRGFNFTEIPWSWSDDVKIFRHLVGHEPDSIEKARISAIPFFNYLDSLVPNHRVARADILYTPPEPVDRIAELEKMHIDSKTCHTYLKRCQLAILGNPDAFLFVEDDCVNIKTDTLIQFNNKKVHWGVNWGSTPKLNMVIEFMDLDVWDSMSDYIKKIFFVAHHLKKDLIKTENYKEQFKKKHLL
jgi:hypothetical protein